MRIDDRTRPLATLMAVGLLSATLACPPANVGDDAGSSGSDAGVTDSAVDAGSVDSGGSDAAGGDAGSLCELHGISEDDITRDLTLVKACSPYILTRSVEVASGATLTIEPGVELRIAQGEWLRVGGSSEGRLIAQGTASEPIRFVSDQSEPTAGSWIGLVFGGWTLSGTVLDHVEVHHAGEDFTSYTRGCVSISSEHTGRITITNSTFGQCQQAGVASNTSGFAFASFSGNTFSGCEAGLWLQASNVGSVAADQTYTDTAVNWIDGDIVDTTATWRAQSVPWVVNDSIDVQDASNPVLTLEAGTTLRFAASEWLRVGGSSGGGLVVSGTASHPVTLESSESSPTAGGWIGVVLGDNVLAGTVLDHAVVRHAGEAYNSYTRGCLTLDNGSTGRVTVRNSRFESCLQSAVAATDSGVAFAAFSANTFVDSAAGLWLNVSAVGSVAADHTYTNTPHNLIQGDTLVTSATWLAQGVPYLVNESIVVEATGNPVLTLAAGNTLRFAASEWLRVGGSAAGGLVVGGSSSAPVVFESREANPTPGSWIGVLIGDQVLAGTVIDHAVVRHGGEAYNSYTKGCLTVDGSSAGRVTVTHSSFESCLQSGVAAAGSGVSFASFATNSFSACDAGLWINASAVGSVAADQTYATATVVHNRIAGDSLVASASWLGQPIPYDVDNSIEVGGTSNPVLTLNAGLTLRFAAGEWLRVGGSTGGGLVVAGAAGDEVVFESSQTVPTAGSWIGLVLGSQTLAGTVIDRATVRHAGEDATSYTKGGISLDTTASRVTISNSSFSDNAQADIFVDCDSTPVLTGNGGAVVVNESNC